MILTLILLCFVALGAAKPLLVETSPADERLAERDMFTGDSEAFRLRSRDLLRQGFRLAVHDVEPSAVAVVDRGKYFS